MQQSTRYKCLFMLPSIVCLLAFCLSAGSVDAFDIRVRARTLLFVEVQAIGTQMQVKGELRDELGQRLPQRRIHIEVMSDNTRETKVQKSVWTSMDGAFSLHMPLPEGRYNVAIAFKENEQHLGARVEHRIVSQNRPVELNLSTASYVGDGAQDVPLNITASVDEVGLPGFVDIYHKDTHVASAELDESGMLRAQISDFLYAGENRIGVRLKPTLYRDQVEAFAIVRLVEDVSIRTELDEVRTRSQHGLMVRGEVADRFGTIPGAHMEIRLTRVDELHTHAASAMTNEEGQFETFIDAGILGSEAWQAEVRFVPDQGMPTSVELPSVKVREFNVGWLAYVLFVLGFSIIMLVAGPRRWAFLARWRSAKRKDVHALRRAILELGDTHNEMAIPSISEETFAERISTNCFDVRGKVWDAWFERPVAAALVQIRRENDQPPVYSINACEDGAFTINALEEGQYILEVRASGYVSSKSAIIIPHSGSLGNVQIKLDSVPIRISRIYELLIEAFAEGSLWGKLSPREIERLLRVALVDSKASMQNADVLLETSDDIRTWLLRSELDRYHPEELLRVITKIVEESCFGGRAYQEEHLVVVKNIALAMLESSRVQAER